jgi:hypothetical protein
MVTSLGNTVSNIRKNYTQSLYFNTPTDGFSTENLWMGRPSRPSGHDPKLFVGEIINSENRCLENRPLDRFLRLINGKHVEAYRGTS